MPDPPKNHQDYDTAFKENLERSILPMLQRQMGIKIQKSQAVGEELKRTDKRNADFIRRVTTDMGEQFLLHIEFQSTNDSSMVHRVGEYHAMLQRRYPALEIRHFVVYFGRRKISMRNQLAPKQVYQGFQLIDISRMDSRAFLQSELPEEILLAILADFKDRPAEAVIRLLIKRLQEASDNENDLQKFLNQLNLFSQVRKLDVLTAEIIKNMPVTIDITQNYWYKEVKKEAEKAGHKEGLEQGLEQGYEQFRAKTIAAIQRMLDKGMETALIAEVMDLSKGFVEAVKKGEKPDEQELRALFEKEGN